MPLTAGALCVNFSRRNMDKKHRETCIQNKNYCNQVLKKHTQIKKKDEIEFKKNPVCVVKSSYLQNCVH